MSDRRESPAASGDAPASGADTGLWRTLLVPLVAAGLLRAALVAAFSGAELLGDERAYLLLGERWRVEGVYEGIWAPGYPALLGLVGGAAGDHAADAVRWLQAALGVWVVACIGALGAAVGGARVARGAAWLAALYLPLAGFSALLYSETLFLALLAPALVLLARDRSAGAGADVALAGVLLGLSALVRESALLLVPLLAAWVALVNRGAGAGPRGGWRAAALLALTAAATVAPWTARNLQVHGRLVPVAISTGGSFHVGLNAHDVNYDLAGLGEDPTRAPGALRAALRGPAPEPWSPETAGAPAERASANVARGLRFAVEHPAYALRSRLVEVVDLLTPLSYPVRSLRFVETRAPLGSPTARAAFAWLAVLMVPALLLAALWGWTTGAAWDGHRWLLALTTAGALASALVSGLSRYRAPALPLLLVFAAVALLAPGSGAPAARRRAGVALGALLALAWIPSLEPLQAALAALR